RHDRRQVAQRSRLARPGRSDDQHAAQEIPGDEVVDHLFEEDCLAAKRRHDPWPNGSFFGLDHGASTRVPLRSESSGWTIYYRTPRSDVRLSRFHFSRYIHRRANATKFPRVDSHPSCNRPCEAPFSPYKLTTSRNQLQTTRFKTCSFAADILELRR